MESTAFCPHETYILVGERMKGERKGRGKEGKEKKIIDNNNCIDENKTGHGNRIMGGVGFGFFGLRDERRPF